MKNFIYLLLMIFTAPAFALPAEKVMPSMVKLEILFKPVTIDVDASLGIKTNFILRILNRFINQPEGNKQALGSGFFISDNGFIVTNAHVVRGADKIRARLTDGRVIDGYVVGRNDELDIGVVKIPGQGFQPVNIGAPDKLKVGDPVFAVGSGQGFFNSVSQGIVSAKNRSFYFGAGLIQTDTFVTHGNSGGGLFNYTGEIVGIPSSGYVGESGLNFCIPIDVAMSAAAKIINDIDKRGTLAMVAQDVPENELGGALVTDIEPLGSADRAGLKKGDVIQLINRKTVKNALDMRAIVTTSLPDDEFLMLVMRNEKHFSLIAKLDGISSNFLPIVTHEIPGFNKAGLSLEKEDGKLVVKRAFAWNIHRGDAVLAVNGKPVKTSRDVDALIFKGINIIEVERSKLKVIVGLSV